MEDGTKTQTQQAEQSDLQFTAGTNLWNMLKHFKILHGFNTPKSKYKKQEQIQKSSNGVETQSVVQNQEC